MSVKTILLFLVPLIFILWIIGGARQFLWPRRKLEAQRPKEHPTDVHGESDVRTAKEERETPEQRASKESARLRRIRLGGLVWCVLGMIGWWKWGFDWGWVSTPPASWSGQSDAQLEQLVRKHAAPFFKKRDIVGITVAVVADGREAVLGFGRSSLDAREPPDGDTVFEIGSISKTFTGILLATQIENGRLELEQLVQSVLPDGFHLPESVSDTITLEHLTTHTAGFPMMPSNLMSPDRVILVLLGWDHHAGYSEADFQHAVATVALKSEPGNEADYSNFSTALLGHVLSQRIGSDYEAAIQENVCRPLGMNDTVVYFEDSDLKRLANGYRSTFRLGPLILGIKSPNWTFPSHLAGAGGIRSTANDMLKYLKANMAVLDNPLTSAIKRSHRELFKENARESYGMNWVRRKNDTIKQTVVWHNGGTGGYRSFIGFTEDGRFGVVILSNTSRSVDPLGVAILQDIARINQR